MIMNQSAWIICALFLVSCLSHLSSAESEEEKGIKTTLMCYGKLLKLVSGDNITQGDDLNYCTVCPAAQTFYDCFTSSDSGTGFALDLNRVLNSQMCKADKVFKLCGDANCTTLEKIASKTDYWKSLKSPVSDAEDTEGNNFVCAQELHRKGNYMYVDALKNHKNMADYYRSYVDGYKECPSRVLYYIAHIYEQALTEGSPVDQMFKQLQKAFADLVGKIASNAR